MLGRLFAARRPILVLTAAVASCVPVPAVAARVLWSISPRDAVLRKLDAATGTTLEASVTISLAGESQVLGGNGLARHPLTGILYALIRVPSTPFRVLVTLDEQSGVATRVGPTGDTGENFAGLSFAEDGTLYAVTGDGALALPPETLCTLSTLDASPSCFMSLGNGSDGEAIGHHGPDGLVYHASGLGAPNDPAGEIFEKIDPDGQTVTPIALSGFDYDELSALWSTGVFFFASDLGDPPASPPRLLRITTTGVVSYVGDMDHVSRGLAPLGVEVPVLSTWGSVLLALLLASIPGLLRRTVRPRTSRAARLPRRASTTCGATKTL